jgi:glutamate racemase
MTNNATIGLFDSGVGGISIWKEIHQLLPNESTIYLADSRNAPYGLKSKDEIIALSVKNTEYLLNQGVKLIVVPCNTATVNAIAHLRATYDVPFIGIEPAIKPAALHSKTQIIGVLATQGTISSELFSKQVALYKNTKIIEQVGHGLVQLIENGEIQSQKMQSLLKTYLLPMIKANIDFLVLGCSHYPFLIPQIEKILPKHIRIIDSGEAVAKQTKNILNEVGFKSSEISTENIFYTNGNVSVLSQFLENKFTAAHLDF